MNAFRTRGRLVAALLSIFAASLLIGGTAPAASAAASVNASGTAVISGTASVPAGTPASCISYYIQSASYRGGGQLGSGGTYSLTGVPAGTYTVYFSGCFLAAKTAQIAVRDGQVISGVNVALAPEAKISGHVTVPAGSTATNLDIEAFDVQSNSSLSVGWTRPSASGDYTINGLPAGSYKYRFYEMDSYSGVQGTLVTEWSGGTYSETSATTVTLAAGQTLTAPPINMVAGATITGHVTGPASSSMFGVCLGAFPASTAAQPTASPAQATFSPNTAGGVRPMAAAARCLPASWGDQYSALYSWPDSSGNYTITRIPPGSYKVMALPTTNSGNPSIPFAPQWYTQKLLRSTADAIPLTLTQSATGIDFTLRPDIAFADVPNGASFHDEITWLGSTGVSTGWTETDGSHTYRPVTPVNRDAMAAFLYRLAGSPAFTAPAVSPFTDVATDNPYYKQITWLADKGISTGYPGPNNTKSFQPLSPVNRDAMAAFLYRFAGSPAYTPPATSPFTDVATNNTFYQQITWLANTKITTGWTEANGTQTFRPVSPVNRDAMAAFMYRYQTMDGQQ